MTTGSALVCGNPPFFWSILHLDNEQKDQKKIHKRYPPDVVCDLSQGSCGRKKLFSDNRETQFSKNRDTTSEHEIGTYLYFVR
jgi:hypothetical protein